MLNEFYIEPKNEEIVWTFHLVGNKEGKQAEAKKATEKKEEARSGDIRDMLPNPRSKKDNQENYCT